MNLYRYVGPVKEFARTIEHNWESYTYAVSEAKARCNLAYQYKKKSNKKVNCKIGLPGRLELIEENRPILYNDGEQLSWSLWDMQVGVN